MKKLSVLFTTFAVAATLSLAGCANVVSSTPDLPVTHIVVFDSNGGTAVASQTVEDGKLATEPTTSRSSYTLVGWYNGSTKYDFTSKVTADLSLTAKWAVVTHTVTFDANGGTAVASQTVEDNGLAISPTTTNGSHNLVGWYNGSVKYDFTSKVTSDLALTAKWTKTVDKKVKYSSSWNVTNTVKSVGYIVLDYTAQTFENYNVVNGVDSLKYSGTYSMTGSSITFMITASTTGSNVGTSTTYAISGDSWTWSADAAFFGFGNKTVATTTVTTTVLTTEEVE